MKLKEQIQYPVYVQCTVHACNPELKYRWYKYRKLCTHQKQKYRKVTLTLNALFWFRQSQAAISE